MNMNQAAASRFLMPTYGVRPPSPATDPMMPINGMPGSPFAVANLSMMPKRSVRPPSPAFVRVIPNAELPGSLFPHSAGRQMSMTDER
jgi:hypothetical protein